MLQKISGKNKVLLTGLCLIVIIVAVVVNGAISLAGGLPDGTSGGGGGGGTTLGDGNPSDSNTDTEGGQPANEIVSARINIEFDSLPFVPSHDVTGFISYGFNIESGSSVARNAAGDKLVVVSLGETVVTMFFIMGGPGVPFVELEFIINVI